MTDHQILIAGFGGQGIQFAGKLLVYIGMYTGKEVSLLPSYGPEMRGGTSSCGVRISDEPIASPLVVKPTVLIALNTPSFVKYESTVVPGGMIYLDTSMTEHRPSRTDVQNFAEPYTRIADEAGIGKMANVVICGKLLHDTGICSLDVAEPIIKKLVPASKPQLFELNMKALEMGYKL